VKGIGDRSVCRHQEFAARIGILRRIFLAQHDVLWRPNRSETQPLGRGRDGAYAELTPRDVGLQLSRAGVRLAFVLNQPWVAAANYPIRVNCWPDPDRKIPTFIASSLCGYDRGLAPGLSPALKGRAARGMQWGFLNAKKQLHKAPPQGPI
jgi:hypothetical protein